MAFTAMYVRAKNVICRCLNLQILLIIKNLIVEIFLGICRKLCQDTS